MKAILYSSKIIIKNCLFLLKWHFLAVLAYRGYLDSLDFNIKSFITSTTEIKERGDLMTNSSIDRAVVLV